MTMVEVRVPDIGDFRDVAVIELLVRPGDRVVRDQSLVTVERAKASMEIPSSHEGVVRELRVALGDKVSEGTALALVELADGAGDQQAAEPPGAAEEAPAASSAATQAAYSAAPPPAQQVPVEVRVPDIGDFRDVAVIEILVKPGDAVSAEQSLITVESDKASMEIPSSSAGIVREVRVALGDRVSQGSPIVLLDAASSPSAGAAQPQVPAAPRLPTPASSFAPTPDVSLAPAGEKRLAQEPVPLHGGLPHASPSIRKLARVLGVPLAEVRGTGPKGRITQLDVESFVKGVLAGELRTAAQQARASTPAASAAPAAAGGSLAGMLPWPQVDFGRFGPVERQDLSRIKKISGANLHRNWVLIPHVTNHDDADVTDLEAFRLELNRENEKSGVKVTLLAFLVKACAAALKKFPEFNASLDGDQLVLKRYFHIGFAADTPNGLVVPVIKEADTKGILQISQEMSELAKKAREGKLAPSEMSGGCFSISSLGGIGGRYFTPIINAPEVAILGVCRSSTEPRWDAGRQAFVPRLILPLSLSWEHRVIDGAAAARFNAYLGQLLGDFRRVLL